MRRVDYLVVRDNDLAPPVQKLINIPSEITIYMKSGLLKSQDAES